MEDRKRILRDAEGAEHLRLAVASGDAVASSENVSAGDDGAHTDVDIVQTQRYYPRMLAAGGVVAIEDALHHLVLGGPHLGLKSQAQTQAEAEYDEESLYVIARHF